MKTQHCVCCLYILTSLYPALMYAKTLVSGCFDWLQAVAPVSFRHSMGSNLEISWNYVRWKVFSSLIDFLSWERKQFGSKWLIFNWLFVPPMHKSRHARPIVSKWAKINVCFYMFEPETLVTDTGVYYVW